MLPRTVAQAAMIFQIVARLTEAEDADGTYPPDQRIWRDDLDLFPDLSALAYLTGPGYRDLIVRKEIGSDRLKIAPTLARAERDGYMRRDAGRMDDRKPPAAISFALESSPAVVVKRIRRVILPDFIEIIEALHERTMEMNYGEEYMGKGMAALKRAATNYVGERPSSSPAENTVLNFSMAGESNSPFFDIELTARTGCHDPIMEVKRLRPTLKQARRLVHLLTRRDAPPPYRMRERAVVEVEKMRGDPALMSVLHAFAMKIERVADTDREGTESQDWLQHAREEALRAAARSLVDWHDSAASGRPLSAEVDDDNAVAYG